MPLPNPIDPFKFHVAISYAGEDEAYVKEVARKLKELGVSVFFSGWQDSKGDLLPDRLSSVFNDESHYCLVFISNHYAKPYPQFEFDVILSRYVKNRGSFIFPARFDDTPIKPPISEITYHDLRPKKLAKDLAHEIFSELLSLFPPPTSTTNASSHQVRFIGREKQLKDIEDLMIQGEERVVVLYGEGGTGKTRLALEILESVKKRIQDPEGPEALKQRFAEGTCKVELKAVSDPILVPAMIAQALNIKQVEGVPIKESIKEFLQRRHMLLLLDNFEHLTPAGECLLELKDACPGLRILVTSRFALDGFAGIRSYPVGPMGMPSIADADSTDLLESDAVQLFAQRASEIDGFKVEDYPREVAAICAALGGVALAILMAAARIRWYEPPEMLEQLQRYLRGEDVAELEELEKAMHASIQWSYDLLPLSEQKLFRCLAVFEGGCTPEDAQKVCADGAETDIRRRLETLADMSLLRRDRNGGKLPRFSMADMVREYALTRLRKEEGEAALRRRHAECFVELAEKVERAVKTPERDSHLKLLDAERANLRAALAWCRSPGGDRELGLRLAGALFWFWNLRADFSEGLSSLLEALDYFRPERAKALHGAGGLAFLQGDYPTAGRLLDQSIEIWRKLGSPHERDLGYSLIIRGMTAMGLDDLEGALASEEESVAIFRKHQAEDGWGLALALNDLGNVQRRRGQLDEALRLYSESFTRWQAVKDDWGMPLTLSNRGFLRMMKGEHDAARQDLQMAADIQAKVKDTWGFAETKKYLGDLAVRKEDFEEAGYLYRESLELHRQIGRRQFLVGCLSGLFVVAVREGRHEVAARLYGGTEMLRKTWNVSLRICDHEMFKAAWESIPSGEREAFQEEPAEGRTEELLNARLDQLTELALREFPPRPSKRQNSGDPEYDRSSREEEVPSFSR